MLEQRDLTELLEYTSPDPVLSVYLNTDLTRGNADTFRLNLRRLLKGVEMPADESAILEHYRSDSRSAGRSLAMYSCAPQEFFRSFPLAVPLRSRVFVGNQPYVKPLADLLDNYGGYGVALVDQQGAHLYFFHMGELVAQEGTVGEDVKRTKRGGASTFPGRRGGTAGRTRHMEETVERNMKDAVEFSIQFFERHRARRLVFGGTEENVRQFQSHLPKAWQAKVVGTFPIDLRAEISEIRDKTLEVGAGAERAREERLVDQMITAAAKGAEGVVRLDDTLGALREGRVQTLVVREGFQAAAFQCRGCSYITTQSLATCPFCGNAFRRIEDAVELAVREVMRAGGEVEIVRDNRELERVEIGGLLRY